MADQAFANPPALAQHLRTELNINDLLSLTADGLGD